MSARVMELEEKLKPILAALNIGNLQEIIEDYLFTEILSRISKFKEEISFFEKKYQKNFEELKQEYESQPEDFEVYEDLMAWEFALEGYNYWSKKLQELKECFTN
ncbi:hypothetical protein [Thermosulfurimonas sp. F29]|uniref:hypothetical protein n=1 Tax=Thermosulfurimonas sp. F29 TaxID=2867247 RepID=UPI001C82D050|nr:hypothetical protein [Thermosulfurimonas sp. F29]MBX6423628.1 hypothetical protein [Thermosulfurimonas sp. F29]